MAFPTSPTNGQRAQEGGLWFTWKECASGTGAWERDRDQLSFYDPIPIGAIMAFGAGQVPTGWLLCDGASYAATRFPELFSVLVGNVIPAPTTFKVPDLRGEFLRGRNPGDVLLSHVDWTTGKPKTDFVTSDLPAQKHTFDVGDGASVYTAQARSVPNGDNNWKADIDNQVDRLGLHDHPAHHHTITSGGDSETAPDHTLVDYCIKATHAKVALPASGFLANPNGALHDGDVWVFDGVANEFKNVPSSTLVSGMTVGPNAPTAPFTGQLWYETDGQTPGLRVYDGTTWVYSTGAGTFNPGAVVKIPGYFDKVPTTTDSPQDVVGLAAAYNGGEVALYGYKAGVFHRLMPYIGDSANEGKVLVGDANGEPEWGQVLPKQVFWNWQHTATSGSLYVHREVSGSITQWARYHGHFVPSEICNLYLELHVNGGTDDAVNKVSMTSGKIVQSGGVWSYGASGRNSGSGVNSWARSEIVPGALSADYRVGANVPAGLNIYVDLDPINGQQLFVRIDGTYTSSNGAPMTCNVWWKIEGITEVNRLTIGATAGHLAGSCHGEFV